MPLKDLMQNKFTPADVTTIGTAVTAIENTLAGKTVNLKPEERKRYGSINEQNKLFVYKISDYHSTHAQHNSPQVDWAEFEKDFAIRKTLEGFISQLTTIVEQLNDTKILHDYDNYQQSLSQYNYIGYLSDENVAGIGAIKDDIAQFFTHTSAATPPKPTN